MAGVVYDDMPSLSLSVGTILYRFVNAKGVELEVDMAPPSLSASFSFRLQIKRGFSCMVKDGCS